MKALEENFRDFITTGKRTFTIPVYQRNYEWKEPECSKLFSDIESIAKNGASHFIGTIVYVTSPESNATWNEFTVIDGQQRITTIMLLLKAIHYLIEDTDIKAEILEDYLTNVRAKNEQYRLKLKPIESDEEIWKNVINDNINDTDPKNYSSNIYRNYIMFIDKIRNSEFTEQQIFEAIEKLEIVYIQLETGKENPQIIFESINSTGLSLTPSDLIRNFLLMNCDSSDKQKRLYMDYWVKIENFLTSQKIPDFIHDYLVMKTGMLIKKCEVYEKFKDFFKNVYYKSEEESLKELCRFSEYYSWFIKYESQDKELNFLLKQFHEIKSFVAFGFMLWIFDRCYYEKKLTKEELYETLSIILCYQYRRLICNYSTNALTSIYSVLPRELDSSDNIPDKLLDILTSKKGKQIFPRNDEFTDSFTNIQIYGTNIAKYTLSMLENKLNPKEQVSLTTQISIEHIMPQTLSPTWKADLGKDFEKTYNQLLHTIGNLTLSGSNTELSNKSFNEKKELFTNSNFSLSRQVSNFTEWNEQKIKERATELSKLALKIWILPDIYNSTKPQNTVDYSSSYNIMDEIEVRNEKPQSYIIFDTEKKINSWKDLFLGVCHNLYELEPTTFEKVLNNEVFKKRHLAEPYNSDYQFRRKSVDEICPGYYSETNFNAQDYLTFTQIIAEIYECQDDISFTLKKPKQVQSEQLIFSEKRTCGNIEQQFKKWLISNGKAESTANSYAPILRGSLITNMELQNIINSNLFTYVTVKDFEKIYNIIISSPKYEEINEYKHHSFSAAQSAYLDYLKYIENN